MAEVARGSTPINEYILEPSEVKELVSAYTDLEEDRKYRNGLVGVGVGSLAVGAIVSVLTRDPEAIAISSAPGLILAKPILNIQDSIVSTRHSLGYLTRYYQRHSKKQIL